MILMYYDELSFCSCRNNNGELALWYGWTNCLKVILSLFAVKSPQTVKRAYQKVTNFTRFLGSCKCQFGKAESFSIVEEGYYVQYSIVNSCVYTWTSMHRTLYIYIYIYIYIAYLRPWISRQSQCFNPYTAPILITILPNHLLVNSLCFPVVGTDIQYC